MKEKLPEVEYKVLTKKMYLSESKKVVVLKVLKYKYF